MLPEIKLHHENASAITKDDLLIVSTGCIERSWQLTPYGLTTTSLKHIPSEHIRPQFTDGCDWQLPNGSEPGPGKLISLDAEISDDQGFTASHISICAVFKYPDSGWSIRLIIWAYPDAPGLRTHLSARYNGDSTEAAKQNARSERIQDKQASTRRYLGYYNDTQNRNDTDLDILKEEVLPESPENTENIDWASIACIESVEGGIALVKESHKCPNQSGHNTGTFSCSPANVLTSTGWGFTPEEVSQSEWTPGWAHWCIVWCGKDLERELAIKTFDHIRYPIDPQRDIYIQANTWGSTDNSSDARRAAREESVLQELEVCAELGIDTLQIDDGWQVPLGSPTPDPGDHGWQPHPESIPHGWQPIKARAAELGVKLGLWASAQDISLEELKKNCAEGGFVQYKLDFAELYTRNDIDELMTKVRKFILWSKHRTRVNWDVTERAPRYGYFFAREYGSIYLENRKPEKPESTIYKPHTVLRDLWQISRYLNLHRFQGSIQNVDQVNQDISDAYLHSHAYAAAITVMAIPLFFLETKYYTAEAKKELKPLLHAYKQHRNAIYQGIVHPVGSKPDNKSWTGFQCHLAQEQTGYLTIFRELHNQEQKNQLQLNGLNAEKIKIENLLTGEQWNAALDSDSSLPLSIKQQPGFLFLKYQVHP